MSAIIPPIPGSVFGNLTILGPRESRPIGGQNAKGVFVYCRCVCGVEKWVRWKYVRLGETRSCGCIQRQATGDRFRKHGEWGSLLHKIWLDMRSRCSYPRHKAFKHYGGRGITVCSEWDDFNAFRDWSIANGYQQGLSIDRRDNDSGYSPDNCRWVTMRVNCRNKSNNVLLTAFGETKCISEWAEDSRCQVGYLCLWHRVKAGWAIEEAITRPPRKTIAERQAR